MRTWRRHGDLIIERNTGLLILFLLQGRIFVELRKSARNRAQLPRIEWNWTELKGSKLRVNCVGNPTIYSARFVKGYFNISL